MLFNRHNFAIKDFCAKSEIRPEIAGIFVTPKETVSTDSFSMIRVSRPEGDIEEYPVMQGKKPMKGFDAFILPKKGAESVFKLFNGDNETLPILNNACILNRSKKENTVEIGKTNLEVTNSVTSQTVEGRYPEFEELFVEQGKYVDVTLNPKLLERIAKFYSTFSDDNYGIIMKIPITKDDDSKPVLFVGKNKDTGQKATALLMTIKSS